MNKKRFIGLVIILAGILTSLSQMAITGAVIGIGKSYLTNILGALITFIGIIIFSFGQKENAGNLEKKVIRTARFEKSIRGHDIGRIERAIDKIGTGRGNEEYVKQLGEYSIRVGHGDRVMFDKKGNTITLLEYRPPSRHY